MLPRDGGCLAGAAQTSLDGVDRRRENAVCGLRGIDDDGLLRPLQSLELRLQHMGLHKMALPCFKTAPDDVYGRVQKQELRRASGFFQKPRPDAWRQRRTARENLARRRVLNRRGERVDPRRAVGFAQGFAPRHFLDIRGRMEIVAFDKHGAEMRRETGGDRRLPRTGDAHDDKRARLRRHMTPAKTILNAPSPLACASRPQTGEKINPASAADGFAGPSAVQRR